MNAQLSVSDCEEEKSTFVLEKPSFKPKMPAVSPFQSDPPKQISNPEPLDERSSSKSPFQVKQNVSSPSFHSAFQTSIKRHTYYPYKTTTQDQSKTESQPEKTSSATSQEASVTKQSAAPLVRNSVSLTSSPRVPPPIPPRPQHFRLTNLQQVQVLPAIDKVGEPPTEKIVRQPPKIPENRPLLAFTPRPYVNPKQQISTASLPSTPRASASSLPPDPPPSVPLKQVHFLPATNLALLCQT